MRITTFWLLRLLPYSWALCRPRNPQVVCLGEALFDCIATEASPPTRNAGRQRRNLVWDVVSERSHDLPEALEASGRFLKLPGGAPANVAVALSRLGTKAAFLGAVGDDGDGEELLSLFREREVDVSAVERKLSCTRKVMVNVDDGGERYFAGFGRRREALPFADEVPEPTLNREQEKLIEGSRMMVTSTLGLAFDNMNNFMHSAAGAAKEGDKTIMVDINWRPVFWTQDESYARQTILDYARRYASFVKITDEEAEWIFPGQIRAKEILDAPEVLLGDEFFPDADLVLVTAGEKGCGGASREGRIHRQQAFDVNSIETTGAGDAFSAGILHYLLQLTSLEDFDLVEALRFASAVGALVTTKYGAWSVPHLHEVESFVAETQ